MTHVPDWAERDLSKLTSLIKDGSHGSHQDVDVGTPFLSAKDVRNGLLRIPENCRRISDLDYKAIHSSFEVQENDILLTIVGSIGRCCILDGTEPRFSFQRSVAVVRPASLDSKYLYHYFRSEAFQDLLRELTNASAQGGVYLESLAGCSIKYPECPREQRQIAAILSTIDKAIEQTEAIIAKQQRIKTGLMQDLLTRGIDEHGNIRSESTHAFKDSPLGPIPTEWEAIPLRELLRFISYGFTNPMPEAGEGPYLVTAANIFDGAIQYDDCRHTTTQAYTSLLTDKSRPQKGDLHITKDGSLGRLGIVDREPLCINQSVAILKTRTEVDVVFLKLLLECPSYQRRILDDAGGSTIKHIYISKLDKMTVAVPKNTDEQNRLRQIILEQYEMVNGLTKILEKLRRKKAALTQDLLTGKVRVTALLEQAGDRVSAA